MIIISDCLTEKVDEGCLKVASSLVKRIKKSNEDTSVISYGRKSNSSNKFMNLNKLFLNRELFAEIKKLNGDILYIPFASNTLASAMRIIVLSLFSRRRVFALFALRHPMNKITELLLKASGASIISLSKKSYDFYSEKIGGNVIYIKTGVDTQRFAPVDKDVKNALREKYGIDKDAKVVLHIGHMNISRNVDSLRDISKNRQIVFVVSSEFEHDDELSKRLEENENIKIIDSFIPNIEEIYQLSDVYLFPVINDGGCIDIPLSVLEAASCGIPAVVTKYGELNEFKGEKGFYFLDEIIPELLNETINLALSKNESPRQSVLEYDWDNSVEALRNAMNQ